MKWQLQLVLISVLACLLSVVPAFAQDEQVYQGRDIRVVARKIAKEGSTHFPVCAWVTGDQPAGLVMVDLVYKDSFDRPLAVSELLLLWDGGPKAFCNVWGVPAQTRDFWKWEIGNVMVVECRDRELSVIASTDPSQDSDKLRRNRADIERLQRLNRIKGC